MSNPTWRSAHAKSCIADFQEQQRISYLAPQKNLAPPPSDRPPLEPIPRPIPLLQPYLTLVPDAPSPIEEKAADIVVGIIGAGPAGLYIAMILNDLGIKYEILEGSSRIGGRIRTHHFSGTNKWNYFDVGAMRYPKHQAMWRVFDLFENRLDLKSKLVPYLMSSENQFLQYNSRMVQQKDYDSSVDADHFYDSTLRGGLVPQRFVEKGVDHWLSKCFTPFKLLLKKYSVTDTKSKGWKKFMEFDRYSARSFMLQAFDEDLDEGIHLKKEAYPVNAIAWMERMNTGTGLFDMAFTEMVLDDLTFDYPNATAIKYGAATGTEDSVPWFCLEGGSEIFIEAMKGKINNSRILYNKRVNSISPSASPECRPLNVTCSDHTTPKDYDYVISTMPLASLRYVDLAGCNLSYAQLEGLRRLRYDSSVKIGMKFRSRWWQELKTGQIKGGQSKTDRNIRTVVFPSYGVDDPQADAVMIASYSWSQDALRIGGLTQGRDSASEKMLVEHVIKEVADLHGVHPQILTDDLEDFFCWDWYKDPFALGAFALYGPSEFSTIYPAFGQGAAGGRLLFAGEALSTQHAWVEGAIESAYEAVKRMLVGANLPDLQRKLKERWSNPNLESSPQEEQDHTSAAQEIIGAILSTFRANDQQVAKSADGLSKLFGFDGRE